MTFATAKRRAPRKLRKRHDGGELRAVVDETIALFHRLRFVAEQIAATSSAVAVGGSAAAMTTRSACASR